MKNKLSILVLVFANVSFCLQAQMLLPIKKEGKWGAIDRNGTVKIQPQYEFVSEFNADGTAMVRQNGLYGLIDSSGEALIPVQYERIDPLQKGYLAVWKNYKVALADRNNNRLTEHQYDVILPIYKDLVVVIQGSKQGVLNLKGEEVLPVEYDKVNVFKKGEFYAKIFKGKKQGTISHTGELLLEAKYDAIAQQGNVVLGTIERGAYGAVFLDEKDKPTETKIFPNQVAWQQYKLALDNRKRKKMIAENPSALSPRWVKVDYRYALLDGTGRNLLGKNLLFYNVSADSVTGYAMGMMDNEAGETRTFIIDYETPKIEFAIEAKDFALIDFREGKFARATIDTLWDALVNKQGEIVQTLSSGGENFPIQDIGDFNEGIAWFKTNGRYGYANADAQVVIPPKYEVGSDVSEGHLIAKLNGKYGGMDKTGNVVIPFDFEGIAPPQEGLFRSKKGAGKQGKWGAVNFKNELVIPYEYQAIGIFENGEASMVQNGRFGLIDKKGKVIIPATLQIEKMEPFDNGIAKVSRDREVQEVNGDIRIIYKKQGYITRTGSFIIPPEYESIDGFETVWKNQQGLSTVRKDGRVGYFDYKGNLVLPPSYFYIEDFESIWKRNKGITKVGNNDLFGFVDHNGNEVVPILFQEISDDFKQVYADSSGIALAKRDGKYGYLNYKAEAEIPLAYDELSEFREGIALAKRSGKWGAINLKNETVIPFNYEGMRFLPKTQKAIIQIFKEDIQRYFVNGDGELSPLAKEEEKSNAPLFIMTDKYDYAWTDKELGVGAVKKGEQHALIDAQGNLLTKFDFREIQPFSEGLAVAQLEAKKVLERRWGHIDTKGKWVVEPTYQKAEVFSDGKAAVMLRQKWGYVNTDGKLMIPNLYRSAEPFHSGFAVVDATQIIDGSGNNVGRFLLEGKIQKGFENERAIVEDTYGFYHLKPNGTPAYFQRHDAVTAFKGKVAFAKRGEIWELSRRTGQYGNFISKVRFTRGKRNEYIEKYGNKRTKELGPGNAMMDMGWEKIIDGSWKMIGKDGTVLTTVTFEEVTETENGFEVEVNRLYGLLDKTGKKVAEETHELIRPIDDTILRLEEAGTIKYYNLKQQQWIWEGK